MRWPWQRIRHLKDHRFYSRWPKTVYFLDGPMKGKTGKTMGGFYVSVLYRNTPKPKITTASWFSGEMELPISSLAADTGIGTWRYDWETCYPTAAVAYVRFGGEA